METCLQCKSPLFDGDENGRACDTCGEIGCCYCIHTRLTRAGIMYECEKCEERRA